jgi:hypothetical protein
MTRILFLLFLLIAITLFSCGYTKRKAKETIAEKLNPDEKPQFDPQTNDSVYCTQKFNVRLKYLTKMLEGSTYSLHEIRKNFKPEGALSHYTHIWKNDSLELAFIQKVRMPCDCSENWEYIYGNVYNDLANTYERAYISIIYSHNTHSYEYSINSGGPWRKIKSVYELEDTMENLHVVRKDDCKEWSDSYDKNY